MADFDGRPANFPIKAYYKGDFAMTFSFTSGGSAYSLAGATATFVISERNGTAALSLSSGSGLTISGAAGTIALAITNAQMVALATQSYLYEFIVTLSDATVWPVLDGSFIVSENGQTDYSGSDVTVALDGNTVTLTIVPTAGGGGGGGGDVSDGDTLATGLTFPNTGLHILDTNASHDLIISPGSDLTADHTLTVTTGDADRTLTLSGDATISGTNTGDVTLAGTPDYITISGQVITRNAIDLSTDTTGALDSANIADGTVSNTEFQYLNGVTSAIQTQIDGKAASSHTHTFADLTSGTFTGSPVATLPNLGSFTIDFNSGNDALFIDDSTDEVYIGDQTGGYGYFNSSDANLIHGGSYVNLESGGLNLVTPSVNIKGTVAGDTPGTITIYEKGSAGSNFFAIKAQDMAASKTYIWPATDTAGALTSDGAGNLTWATAGGSGDILDGGNTTGAAVTIGTNDAFALNLETNNTTGWTMDTSQNITMTAVSATTSAYVNRLTIQVNSTGTPAADFGPAILFQGESSTTADQDMARIAAVWTTATHASREAKLSIQLGDNAGALAEIANFNVSGDANGQLSVGDTTPVTLDKDGLTIGKSFTVGGNSNALTIGGSSGTVTIGASSSSGGVFLYSDSTSNNIRIIHFGNTSSNTGRIAFYNGNTYTQTSGERDMIRIDPGFAPTSGTAIHNAMTFSPTINQTGGANGAVRAIYINPTLTAVGSTYYCIDIAANNSSARGIYQSGTSTTNAFAGATAFGSTTAPVTTALVEMTSTTKGFLPPRMDSTARDAISSPATGLIIYNTTANKINFYNGSAWEAVTSA